MKPYGRLWWTDRLGQLRHVRVDYHPKKVNDKMADSQGIHDSVTLTVIKGGRDEPATPEGQETKAEKAATIIREVLEWTKRKNQ